MTTEKLTQYHTAPSEFVDTVPTPDPGGMIAAYHELTDELATLRADNDARGVVIEQLRAELAKATESRKDHMQGLMDESDRYMMERDEALERLVKTAIELDTVRSENIALRAEAHRELRKLENVRIDRDKYRDRWQQCLRALTAALGES
jgi:hypothetical protein